MHLYRLKALHENPWLHVPGATASGSEAAAGKKRRAHLFRKYAGAELSAREVADTIFLDTEAGGEGLKALGVHGDRLCRDEHVRKAARRDYPDPHLYYVSTPCTTGLPNVVSCSYLLFSMICLC